MCCVATCRTGRLPTVVQEVYVAAAEAAAAAWTWCCLRVFSIAARRHWDLAAMVPSSPSNLLFSLTPAHARACARKPRKEPQICTSECAAQGRACVNTLVTCAGGFSAFACVRACVSVRAGVRMHLYKCGCACARRARLHSLSTSLLMAFPTDSKFASCDECCSCRTRNRRRTAAAPLASVAHSVVPGVGAPSFDPWRACTCLGACVRVPLYIFAPVRACTQTRTWQRV